MLSCTLRASRAGIACIARHSGAGIASRRSLITPTAVRRDLIQDLYLRELRAYKTPPVNPKDFEGNVHKFSPPAAPPSPEEVDIASELKAYELSGVETEGQAEAGSAVQEDNWFEEEPEDDAHPRH